MIRDYKPLPAVHLMPGRCNTPGDFNPPRVRMDSPALSVMTDLMRVPAATVMESASLADTNQAMIHRGVRMLFVTDARHALVGLVTAHDVMGERPVTASQRYGLSLDDLTARHIMTPVDAVEAVSMAEVSRAQVGHVVATLRASGRQHAIAVEHDSEGRQVVRGIFSSAQIARQLGVAVNTSEIALARNFAEIERAMAEA